MRLAAAYRNAALDAANALLNGGSIKVYTGTRPATPETALSGNTLLGTLTLNATAFAAASGGGTNINAVTSDASADATGTATWCSFLTSGGTRLIDATVGVAGSGADVILDTTTVVAGKNIAVTGGSISIPLGS